MTHFSLHDALPICSSFSKCRLSPHRKLKPSIASSIPCFPACASPSCCSSRQCTTTSSASRPERRSASSSSAATRSEEHTSELQSLMRNSYAVFCLTKKTTIDNNSNNPHYTL